MSDLISIIGIVISAVLSIISIFISLKNKADIKNIINNKSEIRSAGFYGCSDIKDSTAIINERNK